MSSMGHASADSAFVMNYTIGRWRSGWLWPNALTTPTSADAEWQLCAISGHANGRPLPAACTRTRKAKPAVSAFAHHADDDFTRDRSSPVGTFHKVWAGE